MEDLVPSIYHERQDRASGSMLCAQHALNNLLQAPLYTPQNLAEIGDRLDALEGAQMDDGVGARANYDDSGFFNVSVIEEALKVMNLRLVRWSNPELSHLHKRPELVPAFLLNHEQHWFAVRRFGSSERFYSLDSQLPQPQWISAMYLGLSLFEAERSDYSIFAIFGAADDQDGFGELPTCEATEMAATLPLPSGSSRPASSMASGSTSKGPRSGSVANGKKRASDDDDDPHVTVSDDDIFDARPRKRRAPEKNAVSELSEEDQVAMAIRESLQVSKAGSTSATASTAGSAVAPDRRAESIAHSEAEAAPEEVEERDEDDDEFVDEPSVEEMRRRRLARFG